MQIPRTVAYTGEWVRAECISCGGSKNMPEANLVVPGKGRCTRCLEEKPNSYYSKPPPYFVRTKNAGVAVPGLDRAMEMAECPANLLATQIGLWASTINSYRRGDVNPPAEVVDALAEYLLVAVEDLRSIDSLYGSGGEYVDEPVSA